MDYSEIFGCVFSFFIMALLIWGFTAESREFDREIKERRKHHETYEVPKIKREKEEQEAAVISNRKIHLKWCEKEPKDEE